MFQRGEVNSYSHTKRAVMLGINFHSQGVILSIFHNLHDMCHYIKVNIRQVSPHSTKTPFLAE